MKVRTTEERTRRGLVGLVGRRGWSSVKVKDAARPCCFILSCLHSVGVGNNIIAASLHRFLVPLSRLIFLCSAPCLEVVGVVAEVLGVDLASEQTIHLQWA